MQTKFNTRLGVRALTHAARTQVPRLTSVAAKMSGALSKISKKYNKKEIFSLKAVFDEADADGSGEIDSSELRKALSKSSLSAAAVDMFKALDKDGSKRIGFDEYLKVRDLSGFPTHGTWRQTHARPTSRGVFGIHILFSSTH